MKAIQFLIVMLFTWNAWAACYNVEVSDHSCRYQKGDDWCKKKELLSFAYQDNNCIEAHPGKKWLQIASRSTS